MKSKKIVSFMLALALCVPVVTTDIVNNESSMISTYADTTADGFEYVINTTQGYVAITGYTGSDTEIVIPSEIEGYPVTTISDETFSYNKNILSVNIPNSITNLGEGVFKYCTKLKTVILSNKITLIKDYTFQSCSSLENIQFSNTLNSIGMEAFEYCHSLKNLILPEGLTKIGRGAFRYCSSLESIQLPSTLKSFSYSSSYPNSNVFLGNTFKGCASLKNVNIPNGITNIPQNCFEDCTSLSEIVLPDTITSIGKEAFKNCTNLEKINIPPYTYINEDAFYGCYILTIYGYAYGEGGQTWAEYYTSVNNINFAIIGYVKEETTTTTTTTEPLITEPSTTTTNELITENNFKNGIYGDMNGDGVANIIDLLLMKKLILDIKVATPLVTTTTKSLDDIPPT